VRADRLLSLVLLLQARGGMTAGALAAELEVSVRTVYRDLEALVASGVPVVTESGPGGGCRLMPGYRFPLRGLRPDEAEALLILGVPAVLRELGLDRALDAAHRQIRLTTGLGGEAAPGAPTGGEPEPSAAGRSAAGCGAPRPSGTRRSAAGRGAPRPSADGRGVALVHLDMPRWFAGHEEVPCLPDLAQALRLGRRLAFRYRHRDDRDDEPRVAGPVGLVNKAGIWYLVAATDTTDTGTIMTTDTTMDTGTIMTTVTTMDTDTIVATGTTMDTGTIMATDTTMDTGTSTDTGSTAGLRVFRVGRITSARILTEPFERPAGFDLATFWQQWSAEFAASRPRLRVTLRASPEALAAFPEIFGRAADPALEAALPPDEHGWRTVTLSFEHDLAAAYRLAGFGDRVEVLTPPSVRARLVTTAQEILGRYLLART
jgi:predicted DNA-binding transcriptional regulator YafY